MDLTGSDILQIAFSGLAAIVVLAAAYVLPQRVAAAGLIILIPFQLITTRYASANAILTCVVFAVMLVRRKDIRLPMLPQIVIVLCAYLVSMALAPHEDYFLHGLYIFNLMVAFIVFWIAYDLAFRHETLNGAAHVFIILNAIFAIYCVVQLMAGPGTAYAPFGINELRMMEIREDYRLTGPFGVPGFTAEYLVIMIYLLAYQIMTAARGTYRNALIGLVGVDFLLLVTTGNRGGLLTLLGSGIVFLWLLRNTLGPVRTLRLAVTAVVLLAIASAIAINYTDYGFVYDRLIATEFDEGVPDTRQRAWPEAWAVIKEQPIFGHGPRLARPRDADGIIRGQILEIWPHNLYLYLLTTVGIVGMIPFLIFLGTPLVRCWVNARRVAGEPNLDAFLRVGFVIMVVIFIDQIKVEFMRYTNIDYWHFIFAVLGVLIAGCDRATMLRAEQHYSKTRSQAPNMQAAAPALTRQHAGADSA